MITSDRTSANSGVRKNVSDTNEYTGLVKSMVDVHEHQCDRLSTSSKHLNELLNGGLETGVLTQFFGGPASGKTHFCHTLAMNLAHHYEILYINTEGSFREDKIKLMAEARRLDWNQLRQNIHLAQPRDTREQELCIKEATSSDLNMKLLIVDSLMFHYRTEYPGRSGLSERAHKLNIMMHRLRTLARTRNIAIVLTNQSVSNLRNEDEDPKPYGGTIISFLSTYIVYLKRARITASCPNITATLVKSPNGGCKTNHLMIINSGFLDLEYSPIRPE